MDFGTAALLTAVFLGLIQEAKTAVWGTTRDRITVGIINSVGVGATWLVATSAWGNEQIIGGKQLDQLGWSSLLLVGVMLGGSASGLWEGFTSLRNIGQNQPSKTRPPAIGTVNEPLPPDKARKVAEHVGATPIPDPHAPLEHPPYQFADDEAEPPAGG